MLLRQLYYAMKTQLKAFKETVKGKKGSIIRTGSSPRHVMSDLNSVIPRPRSLDCSGEHLSSLSYRHTVTAAGCPTLNFTLQKELGKRIILMQ